METIASALLLLSAAQAAPATPARLLEYRVDAGHSIVEFSIGFAFSRVKGRFTQLQGTILYDSITPERSSITVMIESKSIDTGWPNRDRHLRTSDFFDVERFPTIAFRSERLRRVADGWIADGPLSMHGVTKQVSLPFSLMPGSPQRSPESRNMVLNLRGSARLARADFGILGGATYNSWFTRARAATVADSVDIDFEIEAWRADAMTYRAPVLDSALTRIVQAGVPPHLQRLRQRRDSTAPEVWPNYFRGQDFLVRALIAANLVDRASELARGLTELFPTSADPFLLYGFVRAVAGDDRGAAVAYARAKALYRPPVRDPNEQFPQVDDHWYYMDVLTRIALEDGRTKAALGLARVIAELYPTNARALARYGEALALAGQSDAAAATFAEAVLLDPNETTAPELRRRLLP